MEIYKSPFVAVLFITVAIAQLVYSVPQNYPYESSHLQGSARIINGTQAWPLFTQFQVSIRNRLVDSKLYGSGHVCSGSLISENVVLCSAKCFVDNDLRNGSYLGDQWFIAVLGSTSLYEKDPLTLAFSIKKSIKYPKAFNLETYENDIAVAILDGTVPSFHPNIYPVSLNGGPLKGGTVCQMTGWGATGKATSSPELLSVHLPIIPYDVCKKIDNGITLRSGMLCAGYTHGQTGACPGDTGDPLICNDLQAGIASWGNACNRKDKPTGFTDVAYYKDWILSQVEQNKGTLPQFVGTLPEGDREGDGAMAIYNGSLVVVIALVIFNAFMNIF